MPEHLTGFSNATVVFREGENAEDVSVRVFPDWVRIKEGTDISYYPREEIEAVLNH